MTVNDTRRHRWGLLSGARFGPFPAGAPGASAAAQAQGLARNTIRSGRPSVHDGRNYAVVTLEDQIVKIGRRDRPQGR